MVRKIVGLFAAALLAAPLAAQAVAFNISWTGAFGYSMTGKFSYDDALIGSGPITESSLQSFMIEGFQGATSVGTFDLFTDTPLIGNDTFNFNFDTTAEAFLVGGISTSGTGQDWAVSVGGGTCETTGFGFSSGAASQGLCVADLSLVGLISPDEPITVTRAPEPGMLALVGLGLAGLAATRRRRH